MYEEVLVAFAFEKDKDATHKTCYGLVTYLPTGRNRQEPLLYQYKEVAIVRQSMSIEKSVEFLERCIFNLR